MSEFYTNLPQAILHIHQCQEKLTPLLKEMRKQADRKAIPSATAAKIFTEARQLNALAASIKDFAEQPGDSVTTKAIEGLYILIRRFKQQCGVLETQIADAFDELNMEDLSPSNQVVQTCLLRAFAH